MVALTLVIAAAVGKSLSSVKTHKIAPVASKVKSTFSKLASNNKSGFVAAGPSFLRRRSRKEVQKRCARKSLPRVLAPLPADIGDSLVEQVEDGLAKLHADDSESDKASNISHSTTHSGSTLVVSDESKTFLFLSEKTTDAVALGDRVAINLKVELGEVLSDPVYAREALSASELALFEIKVVPRTVFPDEDYYVAPSLVPLAGYDLPDEVQ
ncbi:hypothetical protein OH77DRAFT_1435869 [Trametes cingulata]|nr:hypothetical protein OH77DRAFT_1435869 [Trametes cingulata]